MPIRKQTKYPDEKRREGRVEFYAQVILKAGASEIVTKTLAQDISMTGIFIKTKKNIPVGQDCDVEIFLKGASSRVLLIIKGKVARHTKTGLGIAFNGLEVDTFFLLSSILKNAVLDPVTINNEIFPFE